MCVDGIKLIYKIMFVFLKILKFAKCKVIAVIICENKGVIGVIQINGFNYILKK